MSVSHSHPLPRIMRILSPCIGEWLAGDISSCVDSSAAQFVLARSRLASLSKEMHSFIKYEILMCDRKSQRQWRSEKQEIDSQLRQLTSKRALLSTSEQISLDTQLYRVFYKIPSDDEIPTPPTGAEIAAGAAELPPQLHLRLPDLNYYSSTPVILTRITSLISQGAQLHCHHDSTNRTGDHIGTLLQNIMEHEENVKPIDTFDWFALNQARNDEQAAEDLRIDIPTCFQIVQQCLLSNPSTLFSIRMPFEYQTTLRGFSFIQYIMELCLIKRKQKGGTTLLKHFGLFRKFAIWCFRMMECLPTLNLARETPPPAVTCLLAEISSLHSSNSNHALMERWCLHELLECVNRQRSETNCFKFRLDGEERVEEMQWNVVKQMICGVVGSTSTLSTKSTGIAVCHCTHCTIMNAINRQVCVNANDNLHTNVPFESTRSSKEKKLNRQEEVKEEVATDTATTSTTAPEAMPLLIAEEIADAAEIAHAAEFAAEDFYKDLARADVFLSRCLSELTSFVFLPGRLLKEVFPKEDESIIATVAPSTFTHDYAVTSRLPRGVHRLFSIYSECSTTFSRWRSPYSSYSSSSSSPFSTSTPPPHKVKYTPAYDNRTPTLPFTSLREMISHHVCTTKKSREMFGRVLKSREFKEVCQTMALVEEMVAKMKREINRKYQEKTAEASPTSSSNNQVPSSALTTSPSPPPCPFRDPIDSLVAYPSLHSNHVLKPNYYNGGKHECSICGRHSYWHQSPFIDEIFYSCDKKESVPSGLEDGRMCEVNVCRFVSKHAFNGHWTSWSPSTAQPIGWEVCSRCVEGHVRTQLQKQYQLAVKEQKVDWTLNSIHYRPELHHHPLQCCEVNVAVSCRHCHQMMEESQSILQYRCRFVSCAYSVCQGCLFRSYSQLEIAPATAIIDVPVSSSSSASSSTPIPSPTPATATSSSSFSTPTRKSDLSSLLRDSPAVRSFVSAIYFEFLRRKEFPLVKVVHQLFDSPMSQLRYRNDSNSKTDNNSSTTSDNGVTINHVDGGESALMYLCSRVHGLRLTLFDFLLASALTATNGDINAILSETNENGVSLCVILQRSSNRELLEQLTHAHSSVIVEFSKRLLGEKRSI